MAVYKPLTKTVTFEEFDPGGGGVWVKRSIEVREIRSHYLPAAGVQTLAWLDTDLALGSAGPVQKVIINGGATKVCEECEGRGYIDHGEGLVSTVCPVCRGEDGRVKWQSR